jgi:hypothetical protein
MAYSENNKYNNLINYFSLKMFLAVNAYESIHILDNPSITPDPHIITFALDNNTRQELSATFAVRII